MEVAPEHRASPRKLWAEKSAGISKEIPASLGEAPEGDASFAIQK